MTAEPAKAGLPAPARPGRARPGSAPPAGSATAPGSATAASSGPVSTTAASERRRRRFSTAGAMIGLLSALLGFTLVIQWRSNSTDSTLASERQEDLVRILSDLEAREQRLRQEISGLEDSQRQLTSGAQGRQAAQEEAARRADELGILAGTLRAQGPGLTVRFEAGRQQVKAESLLDAVQELRGAGAEAMQIAGANSTVVRVVAATYLVDGAGGITVDGRSLTAPYTITVIGDAQTMRTALNIAGGVVESVKQAGGTVIVQEPGVVQVTALHASTAPRYARPAN